MRTRKKNKRLETNLITLEKINQMSLNMIEEIITLIEEFLCLEIEFDLFDSK